LIQLIGKLGRAAEKVKQSEEEEMLEKFMWHCALII